MMLPPNPFPRRLLLTSCTRRKKTQPGSLPAWERYEGGCFPLLKRLQASRRWPPDVDLLILSAKYGLLLPEERIAFYDQCMTRERAAVLQPEITGRLRTLLAGTIYSQTFILLEAMYLRCFQGLDFPGLTYCDSFSEQHLRQLQYWLLATPSHAGDTPETDLLFPGGR